MILLLKFQNKNVSIYDKIHIIEVKYAKYDLYTMWEYFPSKRHNLV